MWLKRMHPGWNYTLVSLIFGILLLATIFTGTIVKPPVAKAAACSIPCFMGYYLSVINHGVEAHISTPTSMIVGNHGASSFLMANAQGTGGGATYNFIQLGPENTASHDPNAFCGYNKWGILMEHNQTPSNDYNQKWECKYDLAPGVTHTYAVQLDGTDPTNSNNWTWDYTFDGMNIRRVYLHQEGLDFTTLSLIVGYGETNGYSIQMGGPSPSSHSRISRIGYKSGYTGGFTYPAYPVAYDYAGVNAFSCGCPYGKTPGSDPSPTFWWVDVWTVGPLTP